MKASQIFNRLRIKLGWACPLGVTPADNITNIKKVETPESLDFDPVFLARFPAEELMGNRITILHSSKSFDWKSRWEFEDKSALWNFNLHYFEYLFHLVKAWKDTGDRRYLDKTVEIISGWIRSNPTGMQPGWASYPASLRIVNWISYFGYIGESLPEDFRKEFLRSLHAQFVYLSRHLEKDILGNHYFENLKSLVLAALFFNDEPVLEKALRDFKAECKEEILPDGMHFELSPMYHKIIFEGVLRVAAALRGAGKPDSEIESYLQPMLDAAFSFEDGLERVPLFNDGGNNVAKSLDALTITAKDYFCITPHFKNQFESSGFYIFVKTVDGHTWKLIVDAGQPGPAYIPGHAHCDAMSYELFRDGKPVIVNCGTYAYQSEEREFFRSTAAHNTVMVNDVEQSQYWGEFRLAKRSSVKVIELTDSSITEEMTDQRGQKVKRSICLTEDGLFVTDSADGMELFSYVHVNSDIGFKILSGNCDTGVVPYAVDYGQKGTVTEYEINGKDLVEYKITRKNDKPVILNYGEKDLYRGYKPLAFLVEKLYFYSKGKLWTVSNGRLRSVMKFSKYNWKDFSRLTIRLFRREPKFSVPLDENRMLIAGFRYLSLVNIITKDIQIVYRTRKGFSDPLNICKSNKHWLAIWGDYGPNASHEPINIYGLKKNLAVEIIYSFQPGQIRHVHNIIPRHTGGYYVFTGDQEENAGIYTADDDFELIEPLMIGEQRFRAVVGFDTPEGLLYATDAVNERNYIYLLKDNGELKTICTINGSCIYGTEFFGAYYFATTVEPNEDNRGWFSWFSRKRGLGIMSDDVTLIKIDKRMRSTEIVRYKKDVWPMKLMQYGTIQFPHGEGENLWGYPIAVQMFDGIAVRFDV